MSETNVWALWQSLEREHCDTYLLVNSVGVNEEFVCVCSV